MAKMAGGVERHPHIPARALLDRVVLGGSDGVIECMAMTAALNGASIAPATILLAGLGLAVAGGVSMLFSSYLSRRSELDSLRMDAERERMEIETEPEEEKAELEGLLRGEGYEQKEVDVIMARVTKDKEMWLRAQLDHELHLHIEDLEAGQAGRSASAGAAFTLSALVALVPYALGWAHAPALALSVALSAAALFVLGSKAFAYRAFHPRPGLESAAVGVFAALLLFVAGLLLGRL